MSLSARYVTQSSVYTSPLKGPLTDRAIERYRKSGYYGGTTIRQQAKRKKRSAVRKLKQLEQLYAL